jgi:hypothetical protein
MITGKKLFGDANLNFAELCKEIEKGFPSEKISSANCSEELRELLTRSIHIYTGYTPLSLLYILIFSLLKDL